MTSDFTPLPQIDEGDYVGTLTRCSKAPPRFGRTDLVMEFEVPSGDFDRVTLKAYFQVSWVDNTSFKAGPKSNYFRTYQVCFGEASSTSFEIDDFPHGKYRVEVQNVRKDSRKEPLDAINQYSTIRKIKGSIDDE